MPTINRWQQIVTSLYGQRFGYNYLKQMVSEGAIVAQHTTDASGNITGLVGNDGVTIQIGQSQESTPTDVSFLSLRSTANYDLVAVPSPYSPAHALHFSPVYFKNGFNGYKYWMAFTPYPDSDSVYENPCIVASQDGRTWEVPTGITNPIFAKPAATSAYNSDTDLYWDDANSRFVLLWRTAGELSGTDSGLFISTSSDGITWAARTRIWTGVISSTDIASPSIWYNDVSAKWEIVGHRIDAASPFPFVKITSGSLLSGWDAASTALTMTEPSGRAWWHSTFRRLPGGIIVGILQDNSGTPGASGNLYSAYSADGTTFYTSSLDLNGSWYRPSFVLRDDVLNGEWVCEFYGSKLTTSGAYRAVLRINKGDGMAEYLQTRAALLHAAVIGGFSSTKLLQVDTFNRTDDATALGTATSGGAWTQIVGPTNVLGINTNRCYNVTSGNCRSTRDVGVTDYVVRATLLTKAGENWLWLRYVDTSNYIRIGCTSSGALRYQVVTSGSAVTDTAVSGIPANGDEVIIRAAGAEISIWHNEVYCGKYFSAQGITSTTVGIQMAGATGYLDNYICHAL